MNYEKFPAQYGSRIDLALQDPATNTDKVYHVERLPVFRPDRRVDWHVHVAFGRRGTRLQTIDKTAHRPHRYDEAGDIMADLVREKRRKGYAMSGPESRVEFLVCSPQRLVTRPYNTVDGPAFLAASTHAGRVLATVSHDSAIIRYAVDAQGAATIAAESVAAHLDVLLPIANHQLEGLHQMLPRDSAVLAVVDAPSRTLMVRDVTRWEGRSMEPIPYGARRALVERTFSICAETVIASTTQRHAAAEEALSSELIPSKHHMAADLLDLSARGPLVSERFWSDRSRAAEWTR